MNMKIELHISTLQILNNALSEAIERGMNRCDKYTEPALTDTQRNLLDAEITNSFWAALEEAGVEL